MFTQCGTFLKKEEIGSEGFSTCQVKLPKCLFCVQKNSSVNLSSEYKKAAKSSEWTFQKETWGEK